MNDLINVNAIYKELVFRGHKTFTYLRLREYLLNGKDVLFPEERAPLKKILKEHANELNQKIKQL